MNCCLPFPSKERTLTLSCPCSIPLSPRRTTSSLHVYFVLSHTEDSTGLLLRNQTSEIWPRLIFLQCEAKDHRRLLYRIECSTRHGAPTHSYSLLKAQADILQRSFLNSGPVLYGVRFGLFTKNAPKNKPMCVGTRKVVLR